MYYTHGVHMYSGVFNIQARGRRRRAQAPASREQPPAPAQVKNISQNKPNRLRLR